MLTSEDCKNLNAILENAGCCPRCILIHLGERAYTFYVDRQSVVAEIKRKCATKDAGAKTDLPVEDGPESSPRQSPKEEQASEEHSPPSKRKHPNLCVCCLGVLQSCCDSATIQKVIDAVHQSSYQFQSFVLRLATPPSVELREVLIKLYLKRDFSDLYAKCSDLDIPRVRDAWKWSVGPLIASSFKADASPKSAFSISVKMSHENLEKECKPLLTFGDFPNINGKNKTSEEIYTRTSVTKVIQKHLEALKMVYHLPPLEISSEVKVDSISCSHEPIYFAGRYNKYSRELSQTPWVVDGEKRLVSSVEERIVAVVSKHLITDKIVFSSSGREDVDVRMLGNGRPFVLELMNPKTGIITEDFMKSLQDMINKSTDDIAIRDFQVISKEQLLNLKEGEEEKRKVYSALCCINRPITSSDAETIAGLTNLEVLQKTPIRVLHRRTQAVRKRQVFSMSLEKKETFTFHLLLETQAGTYVKEFVHGDFGRTKPSLGDILNAETDIIELDVQRVELDWPPPL